MVVRFVNLKYKRKTALPSSKRKQKYSTCYHNHQQQQQKEEENGKTNEQKEQNQIRKKEKNDDYYYNKKNQSNRTTPLLLDDDDNDSDVDSSLSWFDDSSSDSHNDSIIMNHQEQTHHKLLRTTTITTTRKNSDSETNGQRVVVVEYPRHDDYHHHYQKEDNDDAVTSCDEETTRRKNNKKKKKCKKNAKEKNHTFVDTFHSPPVVISSLVKLKQKQKKDKPFINAKFLYQIPLIPIKISFGMVTAEENYNRSKHKTSSTTTKTRRNNELVHVIQKERRYVHKDVTIVFAIRRPGCGACRDHGMQLTTFAKQHNVAMIGVIKHIHVDDNALIDFHKHYFHYPLFMDQQWDIFKKVLGDRKVSLWTLFSTAKEMGQRYEEQNIVNIPLGGDIFTQGGVFIFDRKGQLRYVHYENYGKELRLDEFEQIIKDIRSEQQEEQEGKKQRKKQKQKKECKSNNKKNDQTFPKHHPKFHRYQQRRGSMSTTKTSTTGTTVSTAMMSGGDMSFSSSTGQFWGMADDDQHVFFFHEGDEEDMIERVGGCDGTRIDKDLLLF